MKFKYVGKSIPRPDAVNKATGKVRFLDDIRIPGMLHAAFLRPEYAHAKILSIDTSGAETMPGVRKVVTGKDISFRYGDNIMDRIPLAINKVRYIGEPVAAVVAETLHQARQAVKKIKAEYEPLPVYVDARDALKEGAALIHEESGEFDHLPGLEPVAGTNIANRYVLEKGDVEKGFGEADVILEGEFNYPFGSCAALEPHGSVAWFHEDGSIETWSSSICPFIVREDLARVYGLPISKVRVHIPEVGGCFGYKSDVTIEQTVAYVASFVPGHPVKWVATRKEDLLSTLIGHGIRTIMKIGAKKDGTLTAMKTTLLHSTGAAVDTGIHVLIASTHNSTGAYEFPNCYLEGISVYTNTPPVGAYRGYGHQESQFATERMMDLLARKLEMDPFELREKNYLGPGKFTSLGEKLWKTNGDVKKCAGIVREIVFSKPKAVNEDDKYYYGRGFAALMKSPKGAPFSSKGCYLKFNVDGSVTINMGGAEVGQGLRTVVSQVAAEVLKIAPERISVYTEIDTQFSPWEWQTIGSMFTIQGGRAVIRAAEKAIDKLKGIASQALRVDVDMLEYGGDYIFLRSDPSVRVSVPDVARGYTYDDGVTIGEVVQTTADARLPRYSNPDKKGMGTMGVTYTFGAQACEIRIEKETGKIFIDHFVSCFDVGRVINPKQIRGQVAGGVMMAIGATLYEELKFKEDGKAVNPHFSKYGFPTIKEAPGKQTIEFVETPGEIGPFGARGIGEHPVIGVAPSILNAIYDATGIDFYDIPITEDKMKKALAEKKD
ncbi:MAG: xanthine dehydrogenase family protein molybdopterin-binding subunit [Candidatus Tritonobacter lacicola]|nr:xanthine dehydrogenase family protein molybdopterin-binding subunit [Candidatus Tritonobacter lacicola]